MSKDKVVIFEDGYARILTNPDPSLYELLKLRLSPVLINPDLSKVQGLSPEFWKLEDGKVVPMSEHEKQLRSEDLGLFEQDKPFIKEVTVEKIVEVPVEVIKEVEKIVVKEVVVEKLVEVPVEVIREIIEEVPVIKEVIVEKLVEVPVEVIKYVDRPVEVVKEVIKRVEIPVIKEQIKEVIPSWVYGLIAIAILQVIVIMML